MRVETLDRKTATVLTTLEDKVNQKIDENLLTQQGLTRPRDLIATTACSKICSVVRSTLAPRSWARLA